MLVTAPFFQCRTEDPWGHSREQEVFQNSMSFEKKMKKKNQNQPVTLKEAKLTSETSTLRGTVHGPELSPWKTNGGESSSLAVNILFALKQQTNKQTNKQKTKTSLP